MTSEEYKAARRLIMGPDARHTGGKSALDWIDMLGISMSSHRKYVTGERQVPAPVERLIKILMEQAKKVRER